MAEQPTDLIAAAQIPDDWDVIVAGDGSGSAYGRPGGWASIIFEKESGNRKLIYGFISDTTVNVSELTPYIYAMQWYVRNAGDILRKKILSETPPGVAPRIIRIYFVTDCKISVQQAEGHAARIANLAFWRAIDTFGRYGYDIKWIYVPRNTTIASSICDRVSKAARMAALEVQIPEEYD